MDWPYLFRYDIGITYDDNLGDVLESYVNCTVSDLKNIVLLTHVLFPRLILNQLLAGMTSKSKKPIEPAMLATRPCKADLL